MRSCHDSHFPRFVVTLAAVGAMLVSVPASALTYFTADFSGQIAAGSANVRTPFTTVLTQGQAIGGRFTYASEDIPSGTGTQNVLMREESGAPPETLFELRLGSSLQFDYADRLPGEFAQIQYRNGVFNGFSYFSQFNFDNRNWQLNITGRTFNIVEVVGGFPQFSNFVNGTLNTPLTNVRPFAPEPIPEPGTYALMLAGLSALLLTARRRRSLL
jgi:hypothetical protein